ncbi:MAG: phosphorylase [Desulfobulbus propionicus]|nr:MAG: phosphorylase [Desulfobulbus propionicus]
MATSIIDPVREKNEATLPHVGLMFLNPSDSTVLPDLARRFGLQRRYLFHSSLYASDTWFAAGPALGSPMAVLCLEKLVALGARTLVVFGWCGGLRKECHVGDLVLPTWAQSEEGTSNHYRDDQWLKRACYPHPSLRSRIAMELRNAGEFFLEGPLWTTDAPYRETEEKVRHYGDQGILGVDMEYSALCTVAEFRQVQLAAVMLVSDELWRRPWRKTFTSKAFKQRSRACCSLLAELTATGAWRL